MLSIATLRRFEDRFMPPDHQSLAPDAARRARLTARFALTMGTVATVYTPLYIYQGSTLMAVMLGVLGIGYLAAAGVMARTGSQPLAAKLVLLCFTTGLLSITMLTGGINGGTWSWLPVHALLAVLLGGRRTGFRWAAGATVTMLGLVAVQSLVPGLLPRIEIPAQFEAVALWSSVGGAIVVTCVLAGFYETTTHQMLRAIQESHSEAERARERAELARWEAQLVLDSVDQGLVMVDPAGGLLPGRSAAIERWFGVPRDDDSFAGYIGRQLPDDAEWISLAWEWLADGDMPAEVVLGQLERRSRLGEVSLGFRYVPIGLDTDNGRVLVVVTDETALAEAERSEASQRELVAFITKFGRDRSCALQFLFEGDAILDELTEGTASEAAQKRLIHTLKGNAAVFGVLSVTQQCHQLETVLESGEPVQAEALDALRQAWRSFSDRVSSVVDRDDALQLPRQAYEEILASIAARKPYGALLEEVMSWSRERTSARLTHFADQARALAERLGKSVEVTVSDGGLQFHPGRWSAFWSAFVHIVRNAMDHGIETPDARTAAGKPTAGRLVLDTHREGDRIVLEVRDDGAGIDWAQLREVARSRGLPAETQADLIDALFSDGVSTTQDVTALSGRGIGMSAVREAAEAMEGHITVTSEQGLGTVFRFEFAADTMASPVCSLSLS